MSPLVVLSGGQDSTLCLYLAKQKHGSVFCLTFDYEQRHRKEIEAATTIALLANVEQHEVLALGPILWSCSPLVDPSQELETYTSFSEMDQIIGSRIEKTFVPGRNQLFLTIAANRAAYHNITDIYTGICSADNANYPDCTQAFLSYQRVTTNLAFGRQGKEKEIKLHAPLMNKTKKESVLLALSIPDCYAALGFSHTSYSGEYPPVTQDHSTVLRAQGFYEAGVPDPLIVRAYWEGLCSLPKTANYKRFQRVIEDLKDTNDSVLDKLAKLEQYAREFTSISRTD